MDFQALARLHPFRAHFTETGALWPLVGYAGSQTGGDPVQAKNFPERPRLTRALLQTKGIEEMYGGVFAFPCECGASPYGPKLRDN